MKSRITTALLALFLGGIGIHHFYLGKNSNGILSILFSWTFIPRITSFIESIKLFMMSDEEFNLKYNTSHYHKQMLEQFGKGVFNGGTQTQKLDVADELSKLASLMDKGLITFEEFEKRKSVLLK
ncbi:hypothetical protein AD998_12320 [bacterium 336/3]|jgi:TM2 domain-containing membrane protein YozV|nr:hypothetical protein AD998_12320 [bacterium 336/3]